MVLDIAPEYSITGASLFGSRAAGTAGENSDVDLILEFSGPVSLITLNEIKFQLEDLLGLPVDIVHGPLRESDLIGAEDTVELMAAPSAS